MTKPPPLPPILGKPAPAGPRRSRLAALLRTFAAAAVLLTAAAAISVGLLWAGAFETTDGFMKGPRDGPNRRWHLPAGLGYFLSVPIAVALHEGGHLLGGRLAGFRFVRVKVGPLTLTRTRRTTRGKRGSRPGLRWSRTAWRHRWGGMALCVPVGEGRLRERFALFCAAGPAASVAAAVLGTAVWAVLPGWWGLAAAGFAAGNAMTAVGSLIPWQSATNGLPTDGLQLWRLARPGPAADRAVALLRLTAAEATGVPPRDWPADALAAVAADVDGPGDGPAGVGPLLPFAAAADRGDFAAARPHLEAAIARWHAAPAPLRPQIAASAEWYELTVRSDPVAAAVWADAARGAVRPADLAG